MSAGLTSTAIRWRVFAAAIAVVLMLAGRTSVARADEGESDVARAQRLEHTLSYVAADYARGAADGVVEDAAEHQEHLALAAEAVRLAAQLQQAPELATVVAHVGTLVLRLAPRETVDAEVDAVRAKLLASYRIQQGPDAPPDAARGRALYDEHCASCHGALGRGDTARAASLVPHPANFHDDWIGETLSPYRVTTAVRFGIGGTAMIPFTFLSDADRWDLAFYVMSLRHEAQPTSEPSPYTLGELARLSDADLRADLLALGLPDATGLGQLSDARQAAPYRVRVRADALAAARADVDRAGVAIAYADPAGAREALRRATEEGIAASEPALARVAPRLAGDTRHAVASLEHEVDSGASPDVVRPSITAVLRTINRSQRALWDAYGHRTALATVTDSAAAVLRAGALAALLFAALLFARNRGDRREATTVVAGAFAAIAIALAVSVAPHRLSIWLRSDLAGIISAALTGGGALYLGLSHARHGGGTRRSLVFFFAIAFVSVLGFAPEMAALGRSLLACGVARAPLFLGMGAGVGALVAIPIAAGRASGRFAPRTVLMAARPLLCGLSLLFFGEAVLRLRGARASEEALSEAPPSTAPLPLAATRAVAARPNDPLEPPSPCSGAGYVAGPAVRRVDGAPAFEVTANCLSPSLERLEIAIAPSPQSSPMTRVEVTALLEGVWEQLRTNLRERFPRTVRVCVLPGGSAAPRGRKALGCIAAGNGGEDEESDERVRLRVSMPDDTAP